MSKVVYGVIGGVLSTFFIVSTIVWGAIDGLVFPWWLQIAVQLSGPIGFVLLGHLSHTDRYSSYEQNLVLGIIMLTAYFITIAYNPLIWKAVGTTMGDTSNEEFFVLVYLLSMLGSIVGSFCVGRALKIKFAVHQEGR